jgi:hypothetical protein
MGIEMSVNHRKVDVMKEPLLCPQRPADSTRRFIPREISAGGGGVPLLPVVPLS